MDGEAMMRAGKVRREAKPAPKGGGFANGGRVGKAAYEASAADRRADRKVGGEGSAADMREDMKVKARAMGGRVGKGKAKGC